MAAAISCSARIVENGTKQMGHVESVNVVNGECPPLEDLAEGR